jgi:REP element-mobilizing transposase RayT
MPRPTRIEYENAVYHVMNRGRGRRTIFHGDSYYRAFLYTLAEAHRRFDALIHVYCLMGNHYHLLIQTPRANLGRIMRHINGLYTQRYNRLLATDGPLFRGRYKAILVDEDAYLLQVSRYIHRNPIDTKKPLVTRLEDYPWSSYPAYINQVSSPDGLNRDLLYQMLGSKRRYSAYRAYVSLGVDEQIKAYYSKDRVGAILGDQAFRQRVAKEKHGKSFVPLLPVLTEKPEIALVLDTVAGVYGVSTGAIAHHQPGRQKANLARKVAMYCCQYYGDKRLRDIATAFELNHPGSVSRALGDVRQLIARGELKSILKRVEQRLTVIQRT